MANASIVLFFAIFYAEQTINELSEKTCPRSFQKPKSLSSNATVCPKFLERFDNNKLPDTCHQPMESFNRYAEAFAANPTHRVQEGIDTKW
jgi:hypothetical protein